MTVTNCKYAFVRGRVAIQIILLISLPIGSFSFRPRQFTAKNLNMYFRKKNEASLIDII